ncbi:acyltransferase family protein [Paraburkholderia azotifigens]|uniref:acyltransferase family protein n=1 Tax=Paraburkholderia azotifigens TaxID=2057004 RepID=UPI0038BCD1F9
MSQERISFAHILRGFAAVSVVFSHYFGVFWTRPDAVAMLTNAPQLDKSSGLFLLTMISEDHRYFGSGLFGVALFFLISGFVIPFSFNSQSRFGFIVSRFMRLLPTYCVGLTAAIIAVWLCGLHFGRAFPYPAATVSLNYVLGLRDLFWRPSIDGIVWTLEIEVRFYLLCLIISPWLRAANVKGIMLSIAIVALSSFGADLLWPTVSASGSEWLGAVYVASMDGQMIVFMLIGTLFHLLMRGALKPASFVALATATFGIFCFLWKHSGILSPQFVFGTCSFAAALAIFAVCYIFRRTIRGGWLVNWLGDVSYSLYVTHAVVAYVIMRVALVYRMSPWTVVCLAIAWAFVSSTIVHLYVEVPTHKIGRQWAKRLSAKR